MRYTSSTPGFAHLSLADLLRARDQFHPHLIHKRNVVGTAVGRYLIRSGDPRPGEPDPNAGRPKPPRTLDQSEVRDYSWPCVLVFVSEWVDESSFGKIGEIPASEYIPKTIYLDDGKAVPICVVLAPAVTTPPPPAPPPPPYEAHGLVQGGVRVVARTQQIPHAATVGCLLTDGHKVYALTSRHVAGELGEQLQTETEIPLGKTSALQMGRARFEDVYAPWPGKHVFVNFDVALVEVDDLRIWASGIREIGPIGPMVALSTYNLSLSLIGCPVRTFGAASGLLEGQIAALFYRYKSVGGFDYVADFLIGSRTSEPLQTLPGDSGAVWVVDDGSGDSRNPIAVQWGGAVFGAQRTTFALAANLSTIARELNVDLYRGPDVAAFEYWGPVGHSSIGQHAYLFATNEKVRKLMKANYAPMARLANVPDAMWKGGVRKSETPTHYADMDYRPDGGKSLDDLTTEAASLKLQVWRDYYDGIGWTKVSERGLLPFRVWQVFDELVEWIRKKDVDHIVAAAGVLSHYVGDACQPLHSSVYSQGDPFRDPEGNPVHPMRGPFDPIYGGASKASGKRGVHSTYESDMIRAHAPAIASGIEQQQGPHGLPLVNDGRGAAWEAVELMRRARQRMKPIDLVETYAQAYADGSDGVKELWKEYKNETIETMVDGCRVLAMLWDSAWTKGDGDTIDEELLTDRGTEALAVCQDEEDFLPSTSLDDLDDNEF